MLALHVLARPPPLQISGVVKKRLAVVSPMLLAGDFLYEEGDGLEEDEVGALRDEVWVGVQQVSFQCHCKCLVGLGCPCVTHAAGSCLDACTISTS
jgi:hypothetical protein